MPNNFPSSFFRCTSLYFVISFAHEAFAIVDGDGPSNSSATHQSRRAGVAQIVAQAVNVSKMLEADGLPRPVVLPVAWQEYPSGGHNVHLDPSDLTSELLEPYNAGAVWEACLDVASHHSTL